MCLPLVIYIYIYTQLSTVKIKLDYTAISWLSFHLQAHFKSCYLWKKLETLRCEDLHCIYIHLNSCMLKYCNVRFPHFLLFFRLNRELIWWKHLIKSFLVMNISSSLCLPPVYAYGFSLLNVISLPSKTGRKAKHLTRKAVWQDLITLPAVRGQSINMSK